MQLTVVLPLQVQPLPVAPEKVKPEGCTSVTVTAPDVGAVPELVTVIV